MDWAQAAALCARVEREMARDFARVFRLPVEEQRAEFEGAMDAGSAGVHLSAYLRACKARCYVAQAVGLERECAELEARSRELVDARRAAVLAAQTRTADVVGERRKLGDLHATASRMRIWIDVALEFERYHKLPTLFEAPLRPQEDERRYDAERRSFLSYTAAFVQTFFETERGSGGRDALATLPLVERKRLSRKCGERVDQYWTLVRLHDITNVRELHNVSGRSVASGLDNVAPAAGAGDAPAAGAAAGDPAVVRLSSIDAGHRTTALLQAIGAARDELAPAFRRRDAAQAARARAEASVRALDAAVQAEREAAAAAASVRELAGEGPSASALAADRGASAAAFAAARAQVERALRESETDAARSEAALVRAQANLDMATAQFDAAAARTAADKARAAASAAAEDLAAGQRLRARLSYDALVREAALGALDDAELAGYTAQLRAAVATAEALAERREADAARAAEEERFNAAVAAAAAAAAAKTAAEGAPRCVVCTAAPAHLVLALTPCGHRCACAGCVQHLRDLGSRCPVCRATFDGAIRVFHA